MASGRLARLVAAAGRGMEGGGRTILGAQPVVYLGTISYGIYVYHLFMPDLIRPALELMNVNLQPKGLVEFLVVSIATVATAMVSWHLMERPIITLGRNAVRVNRPRPR